MKAVLDTCVIYPTILREILLGVAAAGLYQPLLSERILTEWCLAVRKIGPEAVAIAGAEAALLRNDFPRMLVPAQPAIERRLYLPDANDIHVLAIAVYAGADTIITSNARDFPRHFLAEEGLARHDPDAFLLQLHHRAPDAVASVVSNVLDKACYLAGEDMPLKALMRRARLPRLARALASERARGCSA